MRQLQLIILFLFLPSISAVLNAQIPVNTWRDHLAYNAAHTVAITPQKVYCAMNSGGMLVYDKGSNELQKYSKVNGLSDVDISALAYSEETKTLIIGYENGNIDLLTSDGKLNMPDIKNKRITGVKRINKIVTYQNRAFLACHFGIVDLDLTRKEIRDSYFFGPGGTNILVNDIAVLNNQIYAATESGLATADLNAANLVDFNFWQSITGLPTNSLEFKEIETFNNQLVAAYRDVTNGSPKVIQIQTDGNWSNWLTLSDTSLNQLTAYNNLLCITSNEYAYFYNTDFTNTSTLALPFAAQGKMDTDGTVYVAAGFQGFLKYNGSESTYLHVNGPRFNETSNIITRDGYVIVGSGGPNNLYSESAIHIFNDNNWSTLSRGYTANMGNPGNFYKSAFHPDIENYFFSSAFAFGIYEFQDGNVKAIHDRSTVPLFNQYISETNGVRASDLAFDRDNNLWCVMDLMPQPVFVLRDGGEWERLSLSSSPFRSGSEHWKSLLVTEDNYIWILNDRNGMVVMKEESDGSITETNFMLRNQDGDLVSRGICMVEDKEGAIWVGTNRGPLKYSSGSNIFEDSDVLGLQIRLNKYDGSGLADGLLDYEVVNDIAVDGGNRKWLATASSGVFLVSEDGKKTIHQFTAENSPLLSNTVLSVGVNEKTGEVFFSTPSGIVAFMGTSTEGLNDFTDVYVYPNPVRPDYDGDIIVTGLIEDASVKITDISGNLVYETKSLGGQAVWNGKNFQGDRVNTGVYLVFMSNDDGSKTHITKLVFIK